MLDRVANVASSSTRAGEQAFPLLNVSSSSPYNRISFKSSAAATSTSWINGSDCNAAPIIKPFSVPGSTAQVGTRKPVNLSHSTFPSLPAPSSSTAIQVRKLLNEEKHSRDNRPSSWRRNEAVAFPTANSDSNTTVSMENKEPTAKGKRKKGKDKQTLFTLGTFPT